VLRLGLAGRRYSPIGLGDHYAAVAKPFDWRFTRSDLQRVLTGLAPTAVAA
jgi:hypothetical protein